MHTSDCEQRDAHEAQCNAIGRKIGFNAGLFCDSTSQTVYILATQPLAPNTHNLSIKCGRSSLIAEKWSPEQGYGGAVPFVL